MSTNEPKKARLPRNYPISIPQPAPAAEVPVLMTESECAALLRCSPRTLQQDRHRQRWKVPFLKIGASVVYDRATVLKWLADSNNQPQGGLQ